MLKIIRMLPNRVLTFHGLSFWASYIVNSTGRLWISHAVVRQHEANVAPFDAMDRARGHRLRAAASSSH